MYTNKNIQGLIVIENFINKSEEKVLLNHIEKIPWGGNGKEPNPEMKRRTQHYGHEFNYRYRKVSKYLGPLPKFMDFIILKCIKQGILKMPPNMCIVNEYQPGQGIMAHTDAPSLFGPIILSLSLLSSCLITFTHVIDPTNQFSVILRPRSLLMMTESCRFDYKHSISKDLVEFYGEEKIVRDRRVSLTFRTVISSNQDDINEVENEVLTQKKP